MLPTDASQFRELMETTMTLYTKECPIAVQRMWWAALAPYSFDDVRRAFHLHITGKRGQFAPLPADILHHLRGESGHLGTEEAWALALESMDEATTVVWTDEIAQALAVARPCLEAGDKFNADKAFASAYERSMQRAAPQPVWRVSQGHDLHQRRIALEAAVSAGRLQHDSVAHLLPPPETTESKAIAGLLTGSTSAIPATLDPRWKELGEKLREGAKKAQQEREAKRLADAQEFERKRQAALAAIKKTEGSREGEAGVI